MWVKVFLFLIAFTVSASAQKQGYELIDSLKSKLTVTGEDTSRVRILGKLSFQYFRYDTDLGIYYAVEAIKLAEKLHWDLGLAFSFNYMGTNYAVKGNYPKALEYFHKSLSKYTEIGNKQGIAFLCNNLGNLYRLQKDNSKAADYFEQATRINKELNNKIDLAKNYNNLGIVFANLRDYKKSEKYYVLGLEIANSEKDLELAAQIMINTAENKMELKDYCEAVSLSMQAIDISKKLGITYDRAVYFRHLGNIYLKIAGDKISQMSNCQFYSSSRITNLTSAKSYLLNSISLMEGINDLSELSETSLLLSQVYEQLGDQKNALTYYKKYSAFKDSVFSNDNSLKIAKLEKERELALKDKQIEIQTLEIEKKNSQIITAAVLFAALLLAVFFLPFLYFKRKAYTALLKEVAARKAAEEKIRASLKEKEILLKEVHHRVKNNMQIISSLLDIQSGMLTDSRMLDIFKDSQNRIQAMAMVHELTYKTPDFTNINIKEYFLNLVEHLQHTYLATNKQINYEIEIDDMNLDIDKIISIGLIVNEIITNSLKHAFPHKDTGTVKFSLKNYEGKYCMISLSDNGIGLKEGINIEEQKTLGLFLISSMCEQIGSTLHNSSSDKGTEYIIKFKLEEE